MVHWPHEIGSSRQGWVVNMNAIGDLTILAASLFMAFMFWAASRQMGRANEGTRLISTGLAFVAVSAALDASEQLTALPFIDSVGGEFTEGLAYVGYSIGALFLVFGFTGWLPLIQRLDKEVAGRARAETDLNRALDRARRFNSGLEALGKDHIQKQWNQTELMEEATRRLAKLMGVARISVWSLDHDDKSIECLKLYLAESDTYESGLRLPRTSNPAYYDAIQSGSSVIVADAPNDPVTKAFGPAYLTPLNVGAMLDAPIRTGDGVRGVVCCEHVGGVRYWTSEEVSVATSLAQLIGVAILKDELKGAAEVARSANAAKTAFIANMSHELRTPLNGMLGMAELMAENASTDASQEAAATLIGSGQQLLAVLNDVLDMSKIEAGQMDLRPEPTDIAAVIRECCALFRPAAQKKGLVLESKLGALPDQVNADPVRVRQVLSNLISNAVKFTQSGSVRVSAYVEPSTEGIYDQFVLSVADTGCGISSEDQERLFKRFSQLDGHRTQSQSGSGLGLVIARELARKMDGEISVESEQGAGTCFTFRFLARPVVEVSERLDAVTDASGLDGAQILLVDDNEINRMVARCFIEPLGAVVTEADSGAAALAAFDQQKFDLVLLDAHMPHMDGLETLNELRKRPGGDILPVIVITADALTSDETRYLAAGMDGYVPKPVDKTRLITACLDRLRNGRRDTGSDRAMSA